MEILLRLENDSYIKQIKKSLPRVEDPNIFDRYGNYSPKGLFSEVIFGPTRDYQCACGKYKGMIYEGVRCEECKVLVTSSELRRKQYAYIQLETPVINPMIISKILKIKPHLKQDLMRFRNKNIVRDIEEYVDYIRESSFEDLKSKTEILIKKLITMGVYKTDIVLVTPPDLRPFSKVMSNSDNDENRLYQLILSYNEKFKDTVLEEESLDLYKFSVMREMYKLYELSKSHTSKKSGLARRALLGKENDFTARTVITPNPNLNIDEISVPYEILIDLLRPFIINRLSFKYTHLVIHKYIERLLKYPKQVEESIRNEIYSIVDEIISDDDFVLIINRQPTLHRPSMRAYRVKANNGKTLQVHPFVLVKFGGDFDGDQMAIYMPLTEEAKKDAKEKLFELKNMFDPGKLSFNEISQNIVYGIYNITNKDPDPDNIKYEFKSIDEYVDKVIKNNELEFDFNDTIKVKNEVTTFGRLYLSTMFSLILNIPVEIKESIDSKKLNSIITSYIHLSYMNNNKDFKDRIKTLFEFIIKIGNIGSSNLTLTINDFILDKDSRQHISKEVKNLQKLFIEKPKSIITNINKTNKKLKNLSFYLEDVLPESLKYMVKSGAKGNMKQMSQLFIAKGFVTDIEGNIVKTPIFRSLIDGLTEDEFLLMSKASRKGSADRSLRTADPGYMTRKLIYALNDIELAKDEFCGTKEYLKIKITEDNYKRFIYRYINEHENKKLLTPKNIRSYIGKTVNLYSPITCKCKNGICKTCYGEYNRFLNSKYIGLICAQSLGERTTQLTMRTFHVGASAELKNLFIPEEYFEEEEYIIKSKKKLIIHVKDSFTVRSDNDATLMSPFVGIIKTDKEEIEFSVPMESKILSDKIINASEDDIIYIDADEKLFQIPDTSKDIVNAIQYLLKVVEKTRLINNIYEIYNELDMIFGDLGILSIWYELLISNILYDIETNDLLRFSDDINNKTGIMCLSISKIPHKRILLGIAFENIDKAINNIIEELYKRKPHLIELDNLTIMERILVQDILY